MKSGLRYLPVFLFSLLSFSLSAEKLYWVGGTGNFNDANHWSLQSGGKGGAKAPGPNDDVYFDENSFSSRSIVTFIGHTEVHDLVFTQYTAKVIFAGTQNEQIIVHGDLALNAYIDNQFEGDFLLNSVEANTSVYFSLATLKGSVYFNGNTNWSLQGNVITDDNSTTYFKKGTFNLANSGIYSGNIIASSGITLNTNNSTLKAKNKFVIPAGVTLHDSKSHIFGNIKDPSKFQIDPSVSFNSNSRLHNNSIMSCAVINTGKTDPTCSGSCDGTMSFSIPAGCSTSSNPVYAIWNTGSGCTTVSTGTITPGSTYTVGGICGCGTQYSVIFTNDPTTQDSVYGQFAISIADPVPAKVLSFILKKPTCFGYCDGKVIAQLNTFGALPITLTWTLSNPPSVITHTINNHTRDTVFNACAGNYTVVLTDANGCVSTASVTTLTEPTDVVSAISTTSVTCAGACTGVITNAPSGGTGAITCTIDGAAMAGCTASSLCGSVAGTTYTVIATDANGCKDTTHPVIFAPTPISFTKNPASGTITVNCAGVCSGSIGITGVSGGNGPYTYSWSPATGSASSTATTSTYNNVCGSVAGTTYTCTITDVNTCTVAATFTVFAPTALSHTITGTNPKCAAGQGVTTGSISVTESGGTAGYTFTWNAPPPAGTQASTTANPNTYTSVTPNSYTVNIVDSKGCKDSASITLTPPSPVTGTMTTITDPQCPNLNNGQLCVTAGGGTAGYTYTWSPSPASGASNCSPATLTVSPGGTSNYQVLITDANSCTLTVSGTMTSPPQATVTASVTQVKCGSAPCTGSATLTTSGAPGPFTYAWSCSASTTNSISGQCAGTSCTYTVTDQVTNCKYTGTVTFNAAPSVLSVNISGTTLNCNGDCNSVITSTVSGGTGAITYTWSPGGQTTSSINGQCAGNYTCDITDANGCTAVATTTVASPPALTVSIAATQPSCGNLCDGSMLATITGGSGTYTSTVWNPSVAPPNATNSTLNPTSLCGSLAPGTAYTLTVTDSKGCVQTGNATLIKPSTVTVTAATGSVTCTGLCNGTATATAVGGAGGSYTYSWDNAAYSASTTTSGLCAGTHTLIAKDSNGCVSSTINFTIIQPNPIAATVINIVNTCGACSGSATANPSGGTAPYSYTWTPSLGNGSVATASNLCVGNYTLTVSDTNNCPAATVTFTVNPIVTIAISASSQSVSCNNACDGTATASAANGTAPYSMVWTSSPTYTTVTSCVTATCTASSLCPGTYVITASDANGCTNKDSVVIGNPPALTVTPTQTDIKCFGTCTGSATVTPAGGVAPYTTTWSDGSSGTNVGNLCSGPITATVTDSRGCPSTNTFTINANPQFTVTPTLTPPAICGGNGDIQVTATGGTAPYTSFSWNPTAGGTVTTATPNSTLSGVPAGVYSVTITDSNGCDTIAQVALSDPGTQVVTITSTSVSCFGVKDGSTTITTTGVAPITITWPIGPIVGTGTLTVPNDSAGIYQVTTVDANGCTVIVPDTILGPTQIDDHETITQPTCGSGGSITLNPTGGIGTPYTYVWDGAAGTNTISGLAAGVHTCVVSDGTPCSQTFTYNINPASALTVTVNQSTTRCSYSSDATATVTVSGGTPGYTYTYSGPAPVPTGGANVNTVSSLAAGSFSVQVDDAGGCSVTQTFTITSPSAIAPALTFTNNLCNNAQSGACSGSAVTAASGGTPYTVGSTYTYSWPGVAGNPTGSSIANVCPGSYSVIVTDSLLCKDTVAFTIADPPALTATITSTDPTCFNTCNGTATVSVSGGTGTTYTVSWGGIVCVNCPTASNLCGGTQYTVTPMDSMGCTVNLFYTPNNPTQLNPNVTTTDPVCFNDANGSLVSNTLGGTSPYIYSWSPLGGSVTNTATTSTYSSVPANTYTLIITDAFGCTDTSTHVLNNPTKVTASASATSATCGFNNGSITISSVNGNGAVTINWLSPATCTTSLSCSNLGFGVYSFELTDSKGCKDTIFVPVSNPNGPVIDSVITNVSCNGSSTGSIMDSVVSGVNVNLPYVFTWTVSGVGTITTTSNTSTYSNLPAGTYIATVMDSLGCGTATSFTVTEPLPIQDNGNFTPATCVGINNGAITSIASGGTGTTYTYTLDGTTSNTTGIFNGVSSGSHTVCISDSLSCSQCFNYNIPATSAILSVVSFTNVTCNGTNDGSISLSSVSGGTPNYVITWNNLQTGPVITSLGAGSYIATITDANGCQAIDTVAITAPLSITPNATVTAPACGLCNGEIQLSPSGGTPATIAPAYTYTWTNATNADSLTGVCAGLYQVSITDSLGCTQTAQIPVSNVNSPTVTTTATSPACGSACTGVITTTVVASSSYTYFWLPNGQTTASISNLCAGVYFVEVKDSAGCIATVSDTITAGVTLALNTTVTNPACTACNGAINTNVTGGIGPYTYSWSANAGGATTASISPVCAGAYTIYITDTGSGCKDSIPIGLNSAANGPILTPIVTSPQCHGMCTGTASVNIFGGTAPYTTDWSNGQLNTNPITNLCPAVYVATVTDFNGCVTTTSLTLTEPDTMIRSLPIVVQPKCFGDANGSITTVISGGTPVYTYTWSPATIVGAGGTGLVAGFYSVTVTDANGCTITEFDTLTDPTLLTITGTVTPASCNTIADGAITTTANGGTGVGTYSYTWSGGSSATTANLTNILAGNYSVTVTDANNCKDSTSFTVTALINVTANAGNDTTLCSTPSLMLNGDTTGATSLQWIQLPNPPGPVLGTTLSLTVTPAMGDTTQYVLVAQNGACLASDTISVIVNTTPVPDAGAPITIFVGQSTTIGGSPTAPGGGTIAWTPHAGIGDTTAANPSVTPQVTTQYTVYVTNAAGCVGWDTVTVNVLPSFVIPSGFSPNGDGYNETWQIDYIYMFPNCEVEVYNRWGEQLFYSKGYNTPWAGKYNGKDVPVGTYYYVIRLNDKKFPDHFAGPLTILR